jgi:deoxyribodipyrimidine photolyase-like uncharacterized protein
MPRHLVIVLGDQLDHRSAALDGFDPAHDAVWMAEVADESTHVWTGKPRIVKFLAAMRHFRDDLRTAGIAVDAHFRRPIRLSKACPAATAAVGLTEPCIELTIEP